MLTSRATKALMEHTPAQWRIPFMDFVDDVRYAKDRALIQEPFNRGNERFDAMLASAIEYLCHELGIDTPEWVWNVPACQEPWFVAGIESLKAIAIVESPVYFRRRKIFVLANFLDRV